MEGNGWIFMEIHPVRLSREIFKFGMKVEDKIEDGDRPDDGGSKDL
jgi:hypothetical protein